ncbi:autotransporter domain-containing protein [Flaviaesturariibacter flavus]|uniref:Autotransporter domain-containing protein n=1 Tax=Flaviaesturariibacter flavus TaxID=2502780 RepID=A0A4R1BAW7_9BACT|nr:autotransporter domain-containing protein [Flaviaesturariibacter flavus]TCJ14068.1 autotransporter domain-containing protein [Flaviaesturariibacter flavus]
MKKILLFSIFLACATCVLAQQPNTLHKGRVLLGFSLTGSTSTSRVDNGPTTVGTTALYLAPSVSYFYKDNNALGLAFSYGRQKYSGDRESGGPTAESWGAALERSRYWPIGAGFALAAHLDLGYRHSLTRNYNNSVEQRSTDDAISLYLEPGVTYAFRNRLLIELGLNAAAGIQYFHSRSTDDTGRKTTGSSYGVYTSIGQQYPLFFSMNILLGK